ncbi:NADPH:quinone reductase [Arachnia propionica]|uniref:NADPH:quinone reductase n=1 Tax=Arachnia propionica TaxID=1750 RepID=A0A3P1T4C4_9ACTN|nr:zinc-binding dehydrogenase [Arachnia propionica]RRD04148.1 NADPH:quinone reductase [Arachnia propionica]
MKAVQITSYDGPDALSYDEVPTPEPKQGQISLDVEFAGANYVEALFAGGLVPAPLPWVPGIEVSGRVRALGEGVTGFTSGDQVAALTINDGGGYGQVAVTQAGLVAPLPAGMDPALAAVVPSNTTTALITLERIAHLAPGEHVLVHAAAGGLGSQFGQVARFLGADRVVGVVGSQEKRQAALDLGYDEVWLRAEIDNAKPNQFDVIADPVSGPGRRTSLGLLRLGGRLLAVGDAAQAGDQGISSNMLWFGGIGVLGFNLGTLSAADPNLVGSYLRRALNLVATGEITVHLTEQAPIQDAPRVLAALRGGTTLGKTVLVHETT